MSAAVTAARDESDQGRDQAVRGRALVNPYHRDVLYNLSRLYLLDSAYSKGLPLARQLVTVDPSNPDNYQLIAIAYASMKKEYDQKLKDAEAKAKVYGQRANTSKVAARHEGEHRFGGARSIRSSRPTRIPARSRSTRR